MMNNKEEFKEILGKYLDGQASLEEENRLFAYYEAMQKHKQWDYELMGDEEQVRQDIFSNIIQEIGEEESPKKTGFKKWMIAASAILLLGFCTLLYKKNYYSLEDNLISQHQDVLPGTNKATLTLADGKKVQLDNVSVGEQLAENGITITKMDDGTLAYIIDGTKSEETEFKYNTITTPRGGQYKVVLPDNSVVWLNAASSLKFPIAFIGNTRLVELEGEGYFEVAHDKNKPFIVASGNQRTMVKGTKFNISAYAEDQRLVTTLLEGAVVVKTVDHSNAGLEREVLLKPNEKAVLQGNAITKSDTEASDAIAWKNGYFIFRDEPIISIMKRISRWYNIDVVYQGDLEGRLFGGKYSKQSNLSELLKSLELTETVHFKIDERRVTVMP